MEKLKKVLIYTWFIWITLASIINTLDVFIRPDHLKTLMEMSRKVEDIHTATKAIIQKETTTRKTQKPQDLDNDGQVEIWEIREQQ